MSTNLNRHDRTRDSAARRARSVRRKPSPRRVDAPEDRLGATPENRVRITKEEDGSVTVAIYWLEAAADDTEKPAPPVPLTCRE